MTPRSRQVWVAASVVGLHFGGYWALQAGLLRRAAEVIVPVQVLAEFIAPDRPEPPPPPPQPVKPKAVPTAQPRPQVPRPPAPQPLAVVAEPSVQAPVGVLTPAPPAPPVTAPVAPPALQPTPPAPAPPAPPKVDLPSSDADYLQNPKPSYPALSRRLGEQGRVVVRVLIGVDGTAQQAEVDTSSGYDRLDQAALSTVRRWRYVPGRRGGVPEAMWFKVPINFVLE